MTDCIGAPTREWLEQYVEGTLPEQEVQKFEDHYFDCPVCLGELQAIQAVQEALRKHPIAIAQPKPVLAWPTNWNRMISWGALAAAVLVGFLTFYVMKQRPQSAGNVAVAPAGPATAPQSPVQPQTTPGTQAPIEIAQLADLNLPAYHAPVLRGAVESGAFENGMKQYVNGDCAGAMNTLSQVDPKGPDALAAQFYTGVCRLHTGDLAGAAATLRHVVHAGDTAYQESAFYYLAQIALAQSNAIAARRDLNRVVGLRGDLEHQARKQLAEIPQSK